MDGLFFIENDQFFMYKQDDVWHCHDRYCFVKPVKKEAATKGKFTILYVEDNFENKLLTSCFKLFA